MKEFFTDKGTRVVINPAPTKMAIQLRQAILRQIRKHEIDVGNPKSISDLLNNLRNDASKFVNLLKDIWIDLELDENFNAILSACLAKCTFNNIGITENLFDAEEEAKEYYDKLRYECAIETLKPFFKRTLGGLNIPSNMSENSQE